MLPTAKLSRSALLGTAAALIGSASPPGAAIAAKFHVLHSFAGRDGAYPERGAPVVDSAGTVYGATYGGGPSHQGVVFKLTADGTETILHLFRGTDGANPNGGDPH